MKIYLASSWRNGEQPDLVTDLRAAGHEVYDFRNPRSGGPDRDAPEEGFSWRQCDIDWYSRTEDRREHYLKMLQTSTASRGFTADFNAMKWADVCVLALPCGRSAHLEAGWMIGSGRPTLVYLPESEDLRFEPELMYLLANPAAEKVLCFTVADLVERLKEVSIIPFRVGDKVRWADESTYLPKHTGRVAAIGASLVIVHVVEDADGAVWEFPPAVWGELEKIT